MNAHLKGIPGLGTFTVGRLAGRDAQVLGGKTDRSLDTEVLGLGTINKFGADLLEVLDVARGKGNADLVNFLHRISSVLIPSVDLLMKNYRAIAEILFSFLVRHFCVN